MASFTAASHQGDYNSVDTDDFVYSIHEFIQGDITSSSFKKKSIILWNANAYDWSPQTLVLKGKFKGINSLDQLLGSKARIKSASLGSNYSLGREKWGYAYCSGLNIRARSLLGSDPSVATQLIFSGRDQITGSQYSDSLSGGRGDDVIDGGSGGYDELYGGPGRDTFWLRLHDEVATIWDFNPSEDAIRTNVAASSLSVTHYNTGETTLWAGSDIIAWIKGGEFSLDSLNIV